MDYTGTFDGLAVDFATNKQKASLTLNEDARQAFENLRGKQIAITIKPYKKKRSLEANAYFHTLVGKIAEITGNSKPSIKNQLLSRYGQYEMGEDGIEHFIVRDDKDVSEREDIHLQPTSAIRVLDDGKLYRVYRVIRGTHTYDTYEMSKLIDGTVSEAKELGIETITTTEIEEMMKRYGVKIGEKT